MSFNISFDYRFDTAGFFDNSEARAALEAAADIWESVIGDEFENIPAGVSFFVSDPVDGSSEQVTLAEEIDDLLIFVGASSAPFGIGANEPAALPENLSCGCSLCHGLEADETEAAGALARAGYSGFGGSGDLLNARITSNFRGQGAPTDFEPYAGVASFNTSYTWHYGIEDLPSSGEFDFLTVAVHEIGHVLGIGTAPAYDRYIDGAFYGPNAMALNGGQGVPTTSDGAHVQAGFNGNTVVMDPSISSGQRIALSEFDKAILADIGYEVPGYTKQGSTFAITGEGNDSPVFGTIVADLIDGFAGNDQIQGNDGNDTLIGSEGDDTLFGQDGADSLIGGDDTDQLLGGSGNDTLNGGGGFDTLYGDGGVDVFVYETGAGTDTIVDFEFGTETLEISAAFGFSSPEEVLALASKPFSNVTRLQLDETTAIDLMHSSQSGTPLTVSNIVLEQTPNTAPTANPDTATTVQGQAVTIDVLANDTDPDQDPLTISAFGQPGNGSLEVVNNQFVFTPDPSFTGQIQWDYGISDGRGGGSGSFVTLTVTPPPAEDWLGDETANIRYAGATDDTLRGGLGNDTLGGGSGADLLGGGGDDDLLFGEAGSDVVQGGAGFDVLFGNAGADRLIGDYGVATEGQGDTLNGGSGDDTLEGEGGADRLLGGSGNDSILGAQGFDTAFAGAGNDTVDGGTEGDALYGEGGDDSLIGGGGIDLLAGGADNDTLEGGSGDDFLDGGLGGDTLDGGADMDILLGGAGADRLEGGGGNDTLLAGTENDTLLGGSGNDRIFGEGDNDSLDGGSGNDLVFGNTGNDTATGGAGDDFVMGEDGHDSLLGGSGADVVVGGSGADTLEGEAGDDLLDGGANGDLMSGGGDSDTLFGADGNDTLSGGAAVDVLRGGSGDDRLVGDAGDDRMGGDAGADTFAFAAGDGQDLLFDVTLGTDFIEFTGGVAANFAALTIVDDGAGRATVAYNTGNPGDVITLIGVTAAELSDDGTFLFT